MRREFQDGRVANRGWVDFCRRVDVIADGKLEGMGGLGGQPPPFKNNFRNPANHHPDSRQRGMHASKWN